MELPLVGGFVRRGLVKIRYVGRRSGHAIAHRDGRGRVTVTVELGAS
jgi:hypothetical protein